MTAPRPGAAQGALAYAQAVLAWARREAAFADEATGLATAAAEFAALHAYGAAIEWRWGEDHVHVPVLDAQLAMRFLCPPSPRARIEAQLASRLHGRGVIDLYGDPLTLRLATRAAGPVVIAGEARGVALWREILRSVGVMSRLIVRIPQRRMRWIGCGAHAWAIGSICSDVCPPGDGSSPS